ncbi:MAG: membrane protein insertase YidC [Gammaproteobacteria bacterium]|nr:MAG: membrane protein insertase YidC [Gammaproteobacteria bacterium]
METRRILLFFALAAVVVLLYEAWQTDYGSQPVVASSPSAQITDGQFVAPQVSADVPNSPANYVQPLGDTAVTDSATNVAPIQALVDAGNIHVVTDKFDIDIALAGGDIRRANLRAYPVSIVELDNPFPLMSTDPSNLFIAQSGLLSKSKAPDHHAIYSAEASAYTMAEGSESLQVVLYWQSDDGIEVEKTFTFTRGSHLIDVEHRIINNSSAEWSGRVYRQFQRTEPDDAGGFRLIYTYTGGVLSNEEEKYEKIEFSDMRDKDVKLDSANGWAAMIQHYFLAAWVPDKEQSNHYFSKALDDGRYTLGLIAPTVSVAAGAQAIMADKLYIGPKEQHVLEEIAPGLELTVDYGIFDLFSRPLFWLLEKIHSLVGNWGWTIIIITIIIKGVFFPLSAASYRSMANMRKLQPRIETIRERAGNDKQKMSKDMMALYKTEKINPLGGCLPMLIQIPIFISLYWVLIESVELRQAPFILWISDLAIKDPYYVLPVLMGITMWFQQRLNPKPPDPMQAKILGALPYVFTLFFAFFPSGLVLYWVSNSFLSIAQQWHITRKVERAG